MNILYVISLVILGYGLVVGAMPIAFGGACGAIVLQFFSDFWEKLLGTE